MERLKNNSHVHLPPNFSAFTSIEQVVEKAVDEKIAVLGVTNYYYHDVYEKYDSLARANGIYPLFGLEIISIIADLKEQGLRINDPGNPGRMYICGKGTTKYSNLTERAAELMHHIREADRERMRLMTELLCGIFAERGLPINLTDAEITAAVADRCGADSSKIILQERHLAQAFQEAVFEKVAKDDRAATLGTILGTAYEGDVSDAPKIQGEIRSHLMKSGKPAFVEENFVNFDEAFELITEMGGIPCYPTLADGASTLCEYEADPEKLAQELKRLNIYCAELIPIRNKPEVLTTYATALRNAGIAVVGGTEHNTLDLIPLDPACVGDAPVPEIVKDIFWEGACVVAAHQELTTNGEAGFVDANGNANSDYDSDEERIKAFAAKGASIVSK